MLDPRRPTSPAIALHHHRAVTIASIDARGGLRAARLHPDAHSPVPDALPRLRRRSPLDGLAAHARLADGSGAHAATSLRAAARLATTELLLQRHDRRC
mgnify:CR=1 FL=1